MADGGNGRKIAVIGLACWYPGAPTLRQFWENTLARRLQFRRAPDCRLPASDYVDEDETAPDKTYGSRMAVIDGFEFDWTTHRIPKLTFETADIAHWIALEVALNAIQDAGFTRKTIPTEATGVLVGNSLTGEQTRTNAMRLRWPYVRKAFVAAAAARQLDSSSTDMLAETMEEYYKSVFPPITEDSLSGGLSNTIAGRICNYLDLHGGGYVVDGACSSSLLSVAHASTALAAGDLDMAIAGGVDISLDTFELIGFAKTRALTRSDMAVYDRKGSGFIPGEGCGFAVLKRLDDAMRDGNDIYAVIDGWGVSSDGRGGLTAPSVQGQARAIRRAYAKAGVSMRDVRFIEGHGTGTRVGDRTELEAISLALGEAPPRTIGVTSLKSVIGHTKAAAGIGAFIKAVLAADQRVIPPTASCDEPHSVFDAAARSLYPVTEGEVLAEPDPIRGGVSSMGFGGINCHVTFTSGPHRSTKLTSQLDERALMASPQRTELLLIAADSISGLLDRVRELRTEAMGMACCEVADFAARLVHELRPGASVRVAAVVSSPDDVLAKLDEIAARLVEDPVGSGEVSQPPHGGLFFGNRVGGVRVGLLFPGQGSQKLGMGRILVERFAWAREFVEQADRWLLESGSQPIAPKAFVPIERELSAEGRQAHRDELALTQYAQPAIVVASLLWLEFVRRLGIVPVVVAGHSLGEVTAFHAAGAFDAATAVKLAGVRGRAMSAAPAQAGTMASLTCDLETVDRLLRSVDGYVVVANINGPRRIVISGEPHAVEAAIRAAAHEGIVAHRLSVSNAFHSKLVADASSEIRGRSDLLPRRPLESEVSLVSSVEGREVGPDTSMTDHFGDQIIARVDFVRVVEEMRTRCDYLLEVGPGRVLKSLASEILGERNPGSGCVESRPGRVADLHEAAGSLFVRGLDLNWSMLHRRRLIRPFEPASRKKFIVNPCERPLVGPEPSQVAPVSVGASAPLAVAGLPLSANLVDDIATATGEAVSAYVRTLGSLLRGVSPEPATAQSPSVRSEPPQVSTAPPAAAKVSRPVTKPASQPGVEQRLRELVAQVSGFPVESLPPDAKLLDDLNFDSIKAGELIAAAAKEAGVAGRLDPSGLANATLREIAEAIRAIMPETVDADPAPTAARRGASASEELYERISATTGFPRETLGPELKLLDDLNLDSIKAAEVIAGTAKALGIAGSVDPSVYANASLQTIAEALAQQLDTNPPPVDASSVLDALREEAQAVTGFSSNSLPLDTPLELDDTKGWTIVQRAADRLGIHARVDADRVANQPLRKIADILASVARNQTAEQPTPAPASPAQTVAANSPWVRDFSLAWVESPVDSTPTGALRKTDDWKHAKISILCDPSESDLAYSLRERLLRFGAQVEQSTYAEQSRPARPDPIETTHFVALLPRTTGRPTDPREAVLEAIARLRSIAAPPAAGRVPRRWTTVCFVQFAGGMYGHDTPCPWQGAARAFAASLHLERPDLRVRVVDFAPAEQPQTVTNRVIVELTTPAAFSAAGYDLRGVRRELRMRARDVADDPQRGGWSPDEVTVVTGGARGITAQCTVALARATNTKVALIGSSAPPDPLDLNDERAKTLARLTREGIVHRYYRCDVTDPSEVKDTLARIRSEFGPIGVVVHGAGTNRPRRVEHTSREAAFAEVAPKVMGAIHLCTELAAEPPRLLIGLTSIIGVTGMRGNAWYAYSNEMLDLVFREFANQHGQTTALSVAFSVWSDVGMGARMGSVEALAEDGISAIAPDVGSRRFARLALTDPGEPQVVVAARLDSLDTWRNVDSPRNPRLRFLDNPVYDVPGVESRFRPSLSVGTDPYLEHHDFRGSLLFPAVFGLEAMAQVVSHATGRESLGSVRIEDIELVRPLVIPREGALSLEVVAEVSESKNTKGELRVRAAIRSESTAYGVPHFSAVFVLSPAPSITEDESSAPGERLLDLDLDPATHLYGPILFQGPLFQRLAATHSLDSSQFCYEIGPGRDATRDFFSTWGDCLLGDPFCRDALLQSAQVIFPRSLSLPIRIAQIDIVGPRPGENVSLHGRTNGRQESEDLITASISTTTPDGRPVERIIGYDMRVLERRADAPSAEELAAPIPGDRRLIQGELNLYAERLGVIAPAVLLESASDLHGLTKEERHERESPIIRRLLNRPPQ